MQKNMPVLTLNMNDKIYLAVAKNFTDVFSYVYTLACAKDGRNNQYYMEATPKIHTFKDKSAAHVYHDTIEQLVIMNENDTRYKSLFDFNQHQIKNFGKNIK
ncbi:MAG: hypothetical protein J6R99_02275 [Alphaproteobacteria bacterium]|nr:hypothetical protein [Alphaproteobacteria bacterium]